jgi:hypothetical protein
MKETGNVLFDTLPYAAFGFVTAWLPCLESYAESGDVGQGLVGQGRVLYY